MSFYGEAPVTIAEMDLSAKWDEFMHYMYLPVRIPFSDDPATGNKRRYGDGIALPERLTFLEEAVEVALQSCRDGRTPHLEDPYVYVTARRGYATPGNPLNRPGLHTDDFGGTDLNYVWTDQFPTLFLLADEALDISPDDAVSMEDMAYWSREAKRRALHGDNELNLRRETVAKNVRLIDGPLNAIQRLTPHVIHAAPEIPEPGGMRSFFKISVSTHRYDLVGNSHNHLLDYDWPMLDREALRNQPAGNADYGDRT